MDVQDKFTGCLLGLACGDYLGATVEFRTKTNLSKVFPDGKVKPLAIDFHGHGNITGFYTDDTCQMICLAESLLEYGFDPVDQFRRYKKWFYEGYATPFDDKSYGIGQNTLRILMSTTESAIPTELSHNPKQGGNGALMRCAPVALAYYDDANTLHSHSIGSAIVTHNHEIAAWSCVVLNYLIAQILSGAKKSVLARGFLDAYPNCPVEIKELVGFDIAAIEESNLQTTGYSLFTLAIALWAFYTTKSFADCISRAILIGGDTDTQAAVAGALAGAYYGVQGIPQDWLNQLIKKDYIESLGFQLYAKHDLRV